MTARWLLIPAIVVAVFAVPDGPDTDAPLSTAFTYQGQLKQAGVPLNGSADFEFSLWDADATPPGKQIGSTQTMPNVQVTDGLFTVRLDFGADAFNGEEARWLGVAVRSPAGGGAYTTLSPRQALTAAPFALQTRGITVDGQGNVGIGTTEPAYPLDVEGIIRTKGGIKFPDGSVQYVMAPFTGPRGVQEFATVGEHTWVAPERVHRVMVELWGAGGSGGGGGGHVGEGGGGGGGGGGAGAYSRAVIVVTPLAHYRVVVGAGGNGGAGFGGNGGAGEQSRFEPLMGAVLLTSGGGAGGEPGRFGSPQAPGEGGAGGVGGTPDPSAPIRRQRDGQDGTAGTPGPPGYYGIPGIGGQGGAPIVGTVEPLGNAGGSGGAGSAGLGSPAPGRPGGRGHAVIHW